jgi:hypothetical protein
MFSMRQVLVNMELGVKTVPSFTERSSTNLAQLQGMGVGVGLGGMGVGVGGTGVGLGGMEVGVGGTWVAEGTEVPVAVPIGGTPVFVGRIEGDVG